MQLPLISLFGYANISILAIGCSSAGGGRWAAREIAFFAQNGTQQA
jgi:hypothetical protein